MREAIGGTWLFQIVIVFVLLFTGFICLSINHSKAFNVKNMIINAIEREGKVNLTSPQNDAAIKNIVEYLQDVSYRTTGNCPDGYNGYDRNGNVKSNGKNSAFCIMPVQSRNGDTSLPTMTYYRIVAFYQLDLPIFNQVFNFKVTGDTKVMTGLAYEGNIG